VSSLSSLGSALASLANGSSASSLAGGSNTASTASSATGTTNGGVGSISISGLISGLDTGSIIKGLEAVQQQQINDITAQETNIKAQEAEYTALQTKMTTLQSSLSTLENTTNGAFSGRTATASDPSLATVAASPSAAAGVYNLTVNSIAKANIIASQGFASANSAIGQGTFGISNGNGSVTTVTINSANATLQGLANAINTSGAGVTASIVNDGSGSESSRLLLTSNSTGTANAINITNNLTNTAGGAATPEFGQNSIGGVNLGAGFTGTATPTVNTGAGGYTGTANDQYTFTVASGGTVGSDSIQLQYTDSTGATGTVNVDPSDLNQPVNVAQGLQLTLGSGTLVAGQTFSVKAYVPTVQAAQNASVTLGSGAGALTVQNSTNTLNNLINGVTIQLQKADPTSNLAITVANDTTTPATAINAFVTAYNALQSEISTDTAYDASSSTGGILLGDSRATGIQNQLAGIVGNIVPGINQAANRLAVLGITFDQSGQLDVNSTTLQSALSGGIPGVSLSDINNLFGLSGQSTNSAVQFVSASASTNASNSVTVNVTQAATKASVTSSNVVASQVTIDGSDDVFSLTLDGKSSTVTLAHGIYSQSQLATTLQTAVNSDTDFNGRSLSVGILNNQLTFTSATYGSQSQVTIGSADSNAALGLNGNESSTGIDVQGSFTVNGHTEVATGNGQFLLGATGNANTAGLQVRVNLTQDQIAAGNNSSVVNISQGIGTQLDNQLSVMLDPVSGELTDIQNGYTAQITALDSRKADETTLMNDQTSRLQDEFTQMEQTLQQLQASTNFLTQTQQNLSGTSSTSTSSSKSL
jgi:flagellar hook-associated protein 2